MTEEEKRRRMKLETVIEKELYEFVRRIKEHSRDFTVLSIRKSPLDVDRPSMARTLDVVETAIEDGFFRNVDHFMKKLDAELTNFADTVEDTSPLPSSDK
jgi:isopropylmalate/homocitrate/citramalate synthase